MKKSILVSLAILAVSTSAALAAHRTHHRHYAINPNASAPMSQYAYGGMGPGHDQYMKNLHDAGYDPKNDYSSNGIMRDH